MRTSIEQRMSYQTTMQNFGKRLTISDFPDGQTQAPITIPPALDLPGQINILCIVFMNNFVRLLTKDNRKTETILFFLALSKVLSQSNQNEESKAENLINVLILISTNKFANHTNDTTGQHDFNNCIKMLQKLMNPTDLLTSSNEQPLSADNNLCTQIKNYSIDDYSLFLADNNLNPVKKFIQNSLKNPKY